MGRHVQDPPQDFCPVNEPPGEDRGGLKTSLSTFLPLNGGECNAILNGIAMKALTGRDGTRSVVILPLRADYLVSVN